MTIALLVADAGTLNLILTVCVKFWLILAGGGVVFGGIWVWGKVLLKCYQSATRFWFGVI